MSGTHGAFDGWMWHDNLIYALRLDAPDPDAGNWRSDLVLDIDFISDWLCQADGSVKFRVAPATLTFHDVTDLRIAVDFRDSAHRQTINELSISEVERTETNPEGSSGEQVYYRWTIKLNLPADGEIAFGASGYSLALRDEAMLLDQGRIPPGQRQGWKD